MTVILITPALYNNMSHKCFITSPNTTALTERSRPNHRLSFHCLQPSRTLLLRRKVARGPGFQNYAGHGWHFGSQAPSTPQRSLIPTSRVVLKWHVAPWLTPKRLVYLKLMEKPQNTDPFKFIIPPERSGNKRRRRSVVVRGSCARRQAHVVVSAPTAGAQVWRLVLGSALGWLVSFWNLK
jgi:hypothetical protein